ncbi:MULTISPECIES: hypothetical protein [unclassified Streptomyces]|nr:MULTISPECIES: hypothetical protein [unclassified Streptomyces]
MAQVQMAVELDGGVRVDEAWWSTGSRIPSSAWSRSQAAGSA